MNIYLGYSHSSKSYRVYNKRLHIVEETVHVSIDESYLKAVRKGSLFDGAGVSSESILKDPKENDFKSTNNEEELDQVSEERGEDHSSNKDDLPFEWKTSKDHPINNILGDISKRVT